MQKREARGAALLFWVVQGYELARINLIMAFRFDLLLCRDQMRLATEDHPVMLAEPSHNSRAAREKMVELMFEKYNVPGTHCCHCPMLRCYARTTWR